MKPETESVGWLTGGSRMRIKYNENSNNNVRATATKRANLDGQKSIFSHYKCERAEQNIVFSKKKIVLIFRSIRNSFVGICDGD